MTLRLPETKSLITLSPKRSVTKMTIIPTYAGTTNIGTMITVRGIPTTDNVPNVLRESGMTAVCAIKPTRKAWPIRFLFSISGKKMSRAAVAKKLS
jgi:hypothetical protein